MQRCPQAMDQKASIQFEGRLWLPGSKIWYSRPLHAFSAFWHSLLMVQVYRSIHQFALLHQVPHPFTFISSSWSTCGNRAELVILAKSALRGAVANVP